MTYIGPVDFGLQVARGLVANHTRVNKFGKALDCDSAVATDIWDGADGAISNDIWVAPTAARLHGISSTSASDDGSPVGTGARTVRVYGLQTWSSAESSEDITMNGTTPVNTANSYVIIHRMQVLTVGSTGSNVGYVRAVAATDGTTTAVIQPTLNQTLMAIYGVPTGKSFYMKHIHSTALKSVGSTALVDGTLFVKEAADTTTSGWTTKTVFAVNANAPFHREFTLPPKYTGPCIIKMQVLSDTANTQVTGSFDGYLVTE